MIKQVFKNDYIFLDIDAKDQAEVFKFIAKQAFDRKLVTTQKALVEGFYHREAEGSTGFEEGFAIPHARIPAVKKAAVFILRLKNGIDWKSMDEQPTRYIIALLVPEGPSGDEHLAILSNLALKLMDEEFKEKFKTVQTSEEMLVLLETEKAEPVAMVSEVVNPTEKKLNILAITACVVGIAHTYMAEERLVQTAQKLGHNIRTEAHGSRGVSTQFTASEIENADLVIFATDVNIDKSRFVGKKFCHFSVAKAIKSPEKVIQEAIDFGTVISGEKNFEVTKGKNATEKGGVMKHILAGISYMIPVIVLGGICLAFSIGIAKAVWGAGAGTDGPNGDYKYGPLNILNIIGSAAFTLMIPILAGFIANSIGGRAAIAPAMVGAFVGNNAANFIQIGGLKVETPMGFIGAIIAGLAVGYFVLWTHKWKVPKALAPAMPIFFIPLIAGISISVIFVYVIGGPIGWVMTQVQNGLTKAYSGNVGIGVGLLLGGLLGAMAGFDMGGPINKIAFVTSVTLITMGIQQPMGAMAAAIPVAPLSMGLSTIFFKRFFTEDERNLGIAAIIMGFIGISEGAIPFAIRDPKRAIVSNVVGSLVAGAIAGAFGVTNAAGHGGPIVALLGAIPYGLMTLYFFIAVIAGTVVTTSMYGLWMTLEAGKLNSVREARTEILATLEANKREKVSDLKAQIKQLKLNGKDHSNDVEIASLKDQIKEIKAQFKLDKTTIRALAKTAEKQEREALKTNHKVMRESLTNLRSTQKENLIALKAKEVSKEELAHVKEENHQELVSIESGYRKPYVADFRTKVASEVALG